MIKKVSFFSPTQNHDELKTPSPAQHLCKTYISTHWNPRVIVLLLAFVFAVASLTADCRMMALMGLNGNNLSETTIYDSTYYGFTNPNLHKLKQLGSSNPNGWSLVWYDYSDTGNQLNPDHIVRSSNRANTDPMYDVTVNTIRLFSTPRILLGHVRNASSGSPTIPNPHPFIMRYQDRDYSFMHNGTVNSLNIITLINNHDPNWLIEHPLTTGVDSERYFSWIMLNIHMENGNILQGLKNALLPIYASPSTYGYDINFILSDGMDIYAYRKTDDDDHPLAYYYDVDYSRRNHFLAGVASEFPGSNDTGYPYNLSNVEWSSNRVTHQIYNNELVYISSTGNIVRLPNFAHTDGLYAQKLGFHQGINWVGFPIMKNGGSAPISDVLNYFTSQVNGELTRVTYGAGPYDYSQYNEIQGWNPQITLDQKSLYKLHFTDDSPSIHMMPNNGPMTDAVLIDPSEPVLSSVIADTPYWISYTLLPSQNIKDAFGSSWANVKTVRAENWFYSIPPENPKDGIGEEVPVYSWTTEGKNMDFGKGYIVTFKQNQSSFTWNRSYAPQMTSPGKEKAEFFTWEDKPDYIVIDVLDADDSEIIQEIGVLQDGVCIGAVKTDSFPCQILAYPDYENPSPLTFEIVYNSKAQPSSYHAYELLDLNDFTFDFTHIIPEKDGLYQVKLNENGSDMGTYATSMVRAISNYPNPFNPDTNIYFTLKDKAEANILIYNIKGQLVREMGFKPYKAGINTIKWDGRDNANSPVSSGIYFIRINTGTESHTHKMLMIK
ncbi:MAG: class II glutamine amidotransferase [Syntrophomonadaceae bacterium]